MTDEMKLLMALCDALGFDVRIDADYMETEVSEEVGHQIIRNPNTPFNKDKKLCIGEGIGFQYKRGDNGSYFTALKSPEITYRLIKKKAR